MAARITETMLARASREAAATGRRVELADHGEAGLRLRLSGAGRGSWSLMIRDMSGRLRRFAVGDWPALGLSAARERARALRLAVQHDGADPVAEQRRVRAEAADAKAGRGTLGAVLDLYGGRTGPGRDRKSWPAARRSIEAVFPPILARPISALTAAELQMQADAHDARFNAALAVRSLRPVLRWAARRGYVAPEVAAIVPPATVHARDRVLSRVELAKLLPVLFAPDADAHAAAHAVMLLTAARRSEVAAMRWRDLDLDLGHGEWTIPETKSGRAHHVPVSRQLVALLRRRGPGPGEALVFATGSGGRLDNWDRATKRLQAASGTAGWHRHDLRRTAATLLGELGTPPHVVEVILNHAHPHSALASVYNRARYRAEAGEALQRLADALDGIATGAGAVVALRA